MINVSKPYRLRREDDEDVIFGTIDVAGVPHHFQAVRVADGPDGIQRPTLDPHRRFEDMQALYDGYFHTVKIHGFEGDWAVCVYPFAD